MNKVIVLAVAMLVAGFAFGQEYTVDNDDMYITVRVGSGSLSQDGVIESNYGDFDGGYDFDSGRAIGIVIGKYYGCYALEFELINQENVVTGTSYPGFTSFDATFSHTMGMLNGRWVYENESQFLPYCFAGLGVCTLSVDDGDSVGSVAFQVGLGAEYSITETIVLDVGVRGFRTGDFEFDLGWGTETLNSQGAIAHIGVGARF